MTTFHRVEQPASAQARPKAAPALCYSEADFEMLFRRLRGALDEVLADPVVRAAISD